MARKAEPTGGLGHPFEGGEITLQVRWDGRMTVRTGIGDEPVPHNLTQHELDQVFGLGRQLQGIVYRAHWRAAHAQEWAEEAERERLAREAEEAAEREANPNPYTIEVTHLPVEAASLTYRSEN